MPRAQNKVASRRRRKAILNMAKGYWGSRHRVYTVAKNAVEKSLGYSFRDRRAKKRLFRRLWITRINASARMNDISYSRLIGALRQGNVRINRKVLADLALNEPEAFAAIVRQVA